MLMDIRTDTPTDRPSDRDARTHVKMFIIKAKSRLAIKNMVTRKKTSLVICIYAFLKIQRDTMPRGAPYATQLGRKRERESGQT